MSIQEQLEKITEQMCDNYCKWPEHPDYNDNLDPDKNMEKLHEEKCSHCPMYLSM